MRRMIREVEPLKPSAALRVMAVKKLQLAASLRSSETGKLIQAVHGDLDWIIMKALEKDRGAVTKPSTVSCAMWSGTSSVNRSSRDRRPEGIGSDGSSGATEWYLLRPVGWPPR